MLQKYINSKQKTLKKKPYILCLSNILGGFTIDNIKKTELNGVVNVFFFFVVVVDYNDIDTRDILDIFRYLMKKNMIKHV